MAKRYRDRSIHDVISNTEDGQSAIHLPRLKSELAESTQQRLTAAPMDGHHTGTGRPTRGLSRPVGPQRHLPQLLEGCAITIHQLMGLKLNAIGDSSAMHFTGVLHRKEQMVFLLIQANSS